MKVSSESPRFGGAARLFEWLLSFLLVAGSLATIATFAVIVLLSFADQVPDYLTKEVEVQIGTKSLPALASLPVTEVGTLQAQLTLPLDRVNIYLTHHVVTLLGLIIAVATAFQLRQFVQTLRQDHPFRMANARRLRNVAWLMLFGGIWKISGGIIQISELSRVFPDLGLEFSARGDPLPVVFILILFVVAEVFAMGVKMKEEADLTV